MTPTPLIRAFVCASFCGLALLEVRSRDAATFTPAIRAKIAAASPADQPLHTKWSESARHKAKVAAVKTGAYDLVLIGDSITQCLEDGGEWKPLNKVWEKYYAPRKALNLGYSGQRTEDVLWRLDHGELDFASSPRVFMLLIGTNNTDDQHYPTVQNAEQLVAGTKAILDRIKARHPTSKILVLRVLPCGGPGDKTTYHRTYNRSEEMQAVLRDAHERMPALADNQQVFYLDVNSVFLNPDGTVNPALMPDLIHPNADGAEAMAAAIKPTLDKLLP